jgi:hypothetical protein
VLQRLAGPPEPYLWGANHRSAQGSVEGTPPQFLMTHHHPWAPVDGELTQRVREEFGRNASLFADGCLCGMQLGALRPRGAALLGGPFLSADGTPTKCPRCGNIMHAPHHPFTSCAYTAADRHNLLKDFALDLARLSGAGATTRIDEAPEVGTKPERGDLGPRRRSHVIEWRGHDIQLLSPEQWAAVPTDSQLPLLSVGATWRERAAELYVDGGVEDPEEELFPLWAKLCSAYLAEQTETFWPADPVPACASVPPHK